MTVVFDTNVLVAAFLTKIQDRTPPYHFTTKTNEVKKVCKKLHTPKSDQKRAEI